MKKLSLSCVYLGLVIGLLSGCNTATTATDSENKTATSIGENESGENENYTVHYQGQDCMTCHSSQFSSGGTIFNELNAADGDTAKTSALYTIRLAVKDSVGNTIQNISFAKGRGTGNAYVSWINGGSLQYIAEVVDGSGNVVNKSATLHNQSRFACNRCHTSAGTGGAPGRIVSYDYYTQTSGATTETTTGATNVSFANDVYPVLQQKCQMCHSTTSGRRFQVDSTASATHANLTANALIDTVTPSSSLLLQKGSGAVSHSGGNALGTSYTTVLTWIQEGGSNN